MRQTKLSLKTGLLPFAALAFAVFYALSNDRPWLVLAVGIGALWVVGYLWSRQLERGLRVEREVDLVWASVGDFVHEILRLVNDSRLPAPWVEVVDQSEMVSEPFNVVAAVEARSPQTRRLNHRCDRRGLYSLGPTTLKTGDPFGIYSVTIEDPRTSSVMITPPVLPLSDLRVPPGGWGGDEQRRKDVLERTISDAGIRPYQPGDSLRRVHWRGTARHDELVVRELEASTSGDWWIFLDLYREVQAGEGHDSTLELAVVLAASFAVKGLAEGRRVGLSLAGPELVWLEPSSAADQRWRILQALAAAQAGERPLAELVRLSNPEAVRIATTILITPDPDPAWVARVRDRASRGQVLAVLVDGVSFGGGSDPAAINGALDRSGIERMRYGRPSLEAAYSQDGAKSPSAGVNGEGGRKYLRRERSAWQPVD